MNNIQSNLIYKIKIFSFNDFIHTRMTSRMYFSYILFLVFSGCDFFVTEFFSQGDSTFEGNELNVWWWNIFGIWRHIYIPLWIGFVLIIGNLARYFFKEFFALWWFNNLAFGHLLGFLTWLPFGVLDIFYTTFTIDMTLVFSLTGIIIGLIFTTIQIQNKRLFSFYGKHTSS